MNLPKHISEQKRFSIVARAKSFAYALRGMGIILKTQHNFWVQIVAIVITVALGVYCMISPVEWGLLIFAMTTVLVAEAFNTAIEIDIDLTSPNYHPYAKDTKDVAAGAVLIAVLGAVLIGIVIFIPKIMPLFSRV